ncbi:MAG TPA: hypothetical protein VGP46_07510, partial [Acidimicrobiales bacterium]|nr:hypothetical protein [Acidimicrobiales bacterium]
SMSSTGPKLDPGLGLVLAFVLFSSAIFTLASPNKGASHHGTHLPAYALTGTAGGGPLDRREQAATRSVSGIERLVANPQLEDVSHVVMCVAMGFMLILML